MAEPWVQTQGHRLFETTHWSLVARAGFADDDSQRSALGDLVRRYMPALRAHLMYRRRMNSDQADDLLQAFVTDKLLEKDLVAAARRERGKFRTFLLATLDRFVVSQFRRERRQKRSAPGAVPVDEALDAADISQLAPDERIDIAWARELLNESLRRMRLECESSGRRDVWGVFETRLLEPMLHDAEPLGYEELVRRFNLASPAQASNVLITAKRTFSRVLRELIGEYERDAQQIDAEISDLMTVLSRARD